MSKAIATLTNVQVPQTQDFTQDQMRLIRDTIAKNASPDELQLFLYRAKSMGLDPLKPGQIHFVKYNANSPGSVVVGVEGFRSIAHRSGKLSGIERGVKKDEKGKLTHGWAKVFRSDWEHPAYEETPFNEYDTGYNSWKTKPETMIKKCAEAAALRMAFPNELGGVYVDEEMEKSEPTIVSPHAFGGPTAEDGLQGEELGYRIPFGKFSGRSLEEVDLAQLRGYVEYIEKKAKSDGKAIEGKVLDFINRASDYIAAIENTPIEGEKF